MIVGTICSRVLLPRGEGGASREGGRMRDLFARLPEGALPNESWAVIDRPYSLASLTVGALYERPLFFCWEKRG